MRIVSENVTASRSAIQLRHAIIHHDNIRVITRVSLNCLEPGANHLDDIVLTLDNQFSQRSADALLVIRYQHPHASIAEVFMPKPEQFEGLKAR
jgi:hypothetical protein